MSDTRINTWTIAYRKPRANRFQRVANWSGTWSESVTMAGVFMTMNPGFQVYYVPTLANEQNAEESFGPRDDHGNIFTDTGRRVRMVETGILSDEVLNAFAEKLLSEMGTIDVRHIADAVSVIADTGREDLYPIVDQIESVEATGKNDVTAIPTATPDCHCRNDFTRCWNCVHSFVIRLFRIDIAVELPSNWVPPVRAFVAIDCE